MTDIRHRIRYSETDRTGRLSMQGLLRLFQDLNYLGAEDAGRGIAYQEQHRAAWYLLSWDVHAIDMPRLSECVTFSSHFYQLSGPLAKKYMTLTNDAGDVLAYALTGWAYVDKVTGEPRPFPDGYWQEEELYHLPARFGDLKRVRATPLSEQLPPITVGDVLIDENGHVNNVRFSELALSMLGRETGVTVFRATFVRETKRGDILTPQLSGSAVEPILAFMGQDGKVNAVFSVI